MFRVKQNLSFGVFWSILEYFAQGYSNDSAKQPSNFPSAPNG